MEYISCPIVGDDKYFGQTRQKFALVSDKLHLHAYKIDLSDLYQKKMIITAPLPDYFKADLETLGLSFREF